jgi:hypothetical protein
MSSSRRGLSSRVFWTVFALVGALAACATGQAPPKAQVLPDGRTVVTNTTAGPARYVGQIVYDSPSKELRTEGPLKGTRKQVFGTGALISPRHVLTAAHVLFDPVHGYPLAKDEVYFTPGLNGAAAKFGKAKVIGLYLQKRYEQEAKRKHAIQTSYIRKGYLNRADRQAIEKAYTSFDVAVLLLDRDLSKVVGGHFRYTSLTDKQVKDVGTGFFCNGYDHCDKILPVGTRQLTRAGAITPFRGKVRFSLPATITKNRVFVYPVSLFEAGWTIQGGGSGGPVWAKLGGHPTIVGICTSEGGVSRGVLFDEGYVKWVRGYVDAKP